MTVSCLFTLVTTMDDAIMSAEFPTEEAAQLAAVKWVEFQAETHLCGPLSRRWMKARTWWTQQGSMMVIQKDKGGIPSHTVLVAGQRVGQSPGHDQATEPVQDGDQI